MDAGETRWCSRRNSYRRCLYNLGFMRQIIQENQLLELEEQYRFHDQVIETVMDERFAENLTMALINYDPVCELVNGCQKSDANIGFSTEKWLSFELPYLDQEGHFDNVLRNRLNKVINEYGLAANFLFPRYKGRRFFNNDHYVEIKDRFFQENLNLEGLAQLDMYTNQIGIFEDLFNQRYEN